MLILIHSISLEFIFIIMYAHFYKMNTIYILKTAYIPIAFSKSQVKNSSMAVEGKEFQIPTGKWQIVSNNIQIEYKN